MAALSQLLPALCKTHGKRTNRVSYHQKTRRTKTPYQRIMESKYVDKDVKISLTKQLELLNPFELNNIM
jgi:hypothetical protein